MSPVNNLSSTFRNSLLACALLSALSPLSAQQQPAAEPAPAPQAAPAQTASQTPPPPAAPAAKPERDAFSIGMFGMYGPGQLYLDKGTENTSDRRGDLKWHDDKRRPMVGGVLTIPVLEHHLRFSYFEARNSGNTTAPVDLNIFAGDYDKDAYLATRYKLQNAKISFDYLSWPYPFAGRKFRIHTLWEVQFTNVKGSVDAPLKPVAEGESNATESNKFFIYPSIGLGAEYKASKNFRLEAKGSGFWVPRKPNIWDVTAAAVMRVGKVEFSVGGKGFHFQFPRKTENFFRGTLAGAFVGVAYRFE